MPVKLTIGALQNYTFEAEIEYIAPKATEENGANQFEMKAAVSVPDTRDHTQRLLCQRRDCAGCGASGALSVPESTVEFNGDSTFVYILTDSVPQQRFRRQTGGGGHERRHQYRHPERGDAFRPYPWQRTRMTASIDADALFLHPKQTERMRTIFIFFAACAASGLCAQEQDAWSLRPLHRLRHRAITSTSGRATMPPSRAK